MNKFFTTLVTLAALSVAIPAGFAAHCTGPSDAEAELATPTGHYVDNDFCQPTCLFSLWIYEESNGIPGLQRGDEVVDNTCHGMIEADTIVF